MRVSVRGWGRDHGQKDILDASIEEERVSERPNYYSMGKTYLQVERKVTTFGGKQRIWPPKVHIKAGAKLNLNGSYLVDVELGRADVAKLFYLTHSDRELSEIIEVFASYRQEEGDSALDE